MIPTEFKIAMFNTLTIGPYAQPHVVNANSVEWLIVEKSGPGGTVLRRCCTN